MADDIKKIIQDTATETAKRVNQNLGVLMEDIQSDVKHILETVDTHTSQIKELRTDVGAIKNDMVQMKDDIAVIKTALEQVNLVEMKQDIIDLKKRVEDLETRAA